MIIKNKIAYVYDIEVFPNCFHATVFNTETEEYYKFEISIRKQQINELCDCFNTKNAIFVGYNNHHYDDLIINYIMEYRSTLLYMYFSDICKSLFNMSHLIVQDLEDDKTRLKLNHWKYMRSFDSMDLLSMLFSKKLRVGLKSMQITMQYDNVQEYRGDFDMDIPEKDIDQMIAYNVNDIDSTTELLNRCKKDIELRLWIEQEYGIDALSMDSVKFGERILANEYCKMTNTPWSLQRD